MTNAADVVKTMCDRYQAAVSANDSSAYKKLFSADAIRMPPGSDPEHGPDAIAASEQRDYDTATWTISSVPVDALALGDRWIYGIARIEANVVAHADGSRRSFRATKTWLLEKSPDGEWLIKRQMWNLR